MLILGVKFQKALLLTASAKQVLRKVSDEDDGPFSAFQILIDQLRQRDENLIPNDFIYKDILTVDHNIANMGGVMTDEGIVQDLI